MKNFVFMSGEKIKPNIYVGLCKSSYNATPCREHTPEYRLVGSSVPCI